MGSFDVTYKDVDFEIIPKNALGSDWPSESIRLKLSNYIPGTIMVSSFLLYWFVLVPFIFPATKPKSESSIARCKSFRNIHNLILCVYSGICCFSTFQYMWNNGEFSDTEAFFCTPLEGTRLRPLSVTFTLSKIVEWIDTAFIIWLGRSPPGFLHVYHHATTFWLFCITVNLPASEKCGMLLNGFVHMLMYSHYWRPWPKPLVPFITISQIVQLAFVTYAWSITPGMCPNSYGDAQTTNRLEFLTPYSMVPVFLWLFVLFFVKRFILKKPKATKSKKE
mmetsp:Transcript_17929/g.25299  ORF Transcript_17929/g.25299 Transcript_17929/m.25299 type:complete len:278 (+) Transcript_17929:74-907(+)